MESWLIWIVGLLVVVLLVGGLIRQQMKRKRERTCKAIVVYQPPTTLAKLIREYLKFSKALTTWSGSTGATGQTPNWATPVVQKSVKTRRWIKSALVWTLCILAGVAAGFGIYSIPFSSLLTGIHMPEQGKTLEVLAIVTIGFVGFLLVVCAVALLFTARRKRRKKEKSESDDDKKTGLTWKKLVSEQVEYLEGNPYLVPLYVVIFWGVLTGILWLLRNETTVHWGFSVWNWFVHEHSAAYWVTPLLLTCGGLLYRVESRIAKTIALLFLFLMASLWLVALNNAYTSSPSYIARQKATVHYQNPTNSEMIIAKPGEWSKAVITTHDKELRYTFDRYDQEVEIEKNGRQVFVDLPGNENWVDLGENITSLRFKSKGNQPVTVTINLVPRMR